MPPVSNTHKVTIVVLSKYKDVFQKFVDSVEKYEPNIPRILVADGEEPYEALKGLTPECASNWALVPGAEKFSMAGNGNLGWKAVPLDNDILYCGDDLRFTQPIIAKLQEIAYSKPNIGILSPKLVGRGSSPQVNPPGKLVSVPPLHMWFPCIYIKRELITKIGYLDERFNDFGCDDFDYCIRTLQAGYILAVTSEVSVEHEASSEGGPTTFIKKLGVQQWDLQQREAQRKIRQKYNMTPAVFNDFLRTGNIELLKNNGKDIPVPTVITTDTPKEEAAAYLRSRHPMICTPAYGALMTVNFVNMVISFIDSCKNLEIPYSTAFLYNESLITRARNKLCDLFLRNEAATDLLFIDADISCSVQDLISLLFHPEEIIAVPCARKNLRLDRVYNAGKANYPDNSISELRKLCGEFVLNFPPENTPTKMNLGQLVEVQDGGTGLMRIKRSALEKFRDAYPDRYYLPMSGEEGENGGERKPMFMFFQSRLDEDSAKFNPGNLPDYISEDYAFCVPPGYKVYGDMQEIENHHESSHVVTHTGNLQAVTSTIERDYNGELTVITPWHGGKFELTPNHLVLVSRNENIEFVPAKEIRKDDKLVVPFPKGNEEPILTLQNPPARNKYIDIKDNKFKYTRTSKMSPWFPLEVQITDDLCSLFGYWIAEGCWQGGCTTFAFNKNELEYIADVQSLLMNCLGLDSYTITEDNCTSVIVESVAFGDFMMHNFGRYSRERKVPDELLTGKLSWIKALLRSYWRGDGTKNFPYDIGTTSRELAHAVRYMMLRCGIYPSFCEAPHRYFNDDRKAYGVMPQSNFRKLWAEIIGVPDYSNFDLKENSNRTHLWGAKRKAERQGDNFFVMIKKLESTTYKGKVYNLSVDKDETYNIHGFAVHNCRDARKVGMKVYAAPWIETQHCGSYLFQGSLLAVQKAGGFLR